MFVVVGLGSKLVGRAHSSEHHYSLYKIIISIKKAFFLRPLKEKYQCDRNRICISYCTPLVNFINILRMNFLYESAFFRRNPFAKAKT